MNQKKWIYLPRQSEDIVEQLLINRKIEKNDQDDFLNPDFSIGLHDPYLLQDMEKAVKRIGKAIDNQEIVGIFGDYDADGIPASAVLMEVLNRHGLETLVYIPSRSEGYGMNRKGIDELKSQGVTLLITVDLGIREIDNTVYAQSLGLDVIITDHHEPAEIIPDAVAVVNPKRKNSHYPFRELSGGGVVFKLAQALSIRFNKISVNDLKWLLDLVAITTICDVVPLINENRIFAKYGLIVLAKTKRLGLKKLYEIAQIDPQKINTYTVGFQIGPRLNAPGRLNQKRESFDLIVAKNVDQATKMAIELDSVNQQRQSDLEKILKEARKRVIKEKQNKNKIIFVYDKGWPSGLIGLVAGKLVEEFARPAIVLEQNDKISKGSARSIDNFNIVEVLEEAKDLLESFGGHSKAAGLSLENKNLELFYQKMVQIADRKLTESDLVSKIIIDAQLDESELVLDLVEKIEALEPFGLGNPRPVFALKNVHPINVKTIGQLNNHLKFNLGSIDVIGFGLGEFKNMIIDQDIDIAFTLEENIWQNIRKLQIKIIDLKVNM